MMGNSEAIRHLVRAKQLLADLDRSRRGVDLDQVRAGVGHELSNALQCLQEPATGNREGKVRRDAPATSQRAARRIKVKAGTQRARVLVALAAAPYGLTDHELTLQVGIQPSSLRPRRGELADEGYVTPGVLLSGEPATRQHGNEMWTVWVATEAGRTLAWSLARSERPEVPHHPGEQMTLT